MATGNTLSSYSALLKRFYTKDKIEDSTFQECPLTALLPKMENAGGIDYNVPLITGYGQGGSTTFATAQRIAGVSGTAASVFRLNFAETWQVGQIDSNLLLQSEDEGEKAFLSAASNVMDTALQNQSVDLELKLFGDGTGFRGTIGTATTIASSTVTLALVDDCMKFEVGMNIQLAATSAGSIRAQGTNSTDLVIGSINYLAGTFTVVGSNGVACNISDSTYGVPAAATGDVIFRSGDQSTTQTLDGGTSGNVVTGLAGWLPYGGPASSDSFSLSAVNRSVNSARLAGLYMDGTAYSTEECLIRAAGLVKQFGHNIDVFLMNWKKFSALTTSMTSKLQIVDFDVTPKVGFRAVEIIGPSGKPIKIVGCRNCPSTSIYGLTMDAWNLVSKRKAVFVWDLDNLEWLRQSTGSGMEIRIYSLLNLFCKNPIANINIKVNAA